MIIYSYYIESVIVITIIYPSYSSFPRITLSLAIRITVVNIDCVVATGTNLHRCCSSRCRNKCCHVDCWLSPWLSICAHAHLILFALECNNFRGSAITLAAVLYHLILHSNRPIRLQYLLQLYNNYIYNYIIYRYFFTLSFGLVICP